MSVLAAMMADETLTTEEQQRMKVAFAEGYLAGTGQRPTGWTKRCLNIIQQMLTIVVLFVIFVSFMGELFICSSSIKSQLFPFIL